MRFTNICTDTYACDIELRPALSSGHWTLRNKDGDLGYEYVLLSCSISKLSRIERHAE